MLSLSRYLPMFQFSERHSCLVAADPAQVIAAAAAYQPHDDPIFRFLIGLRAVPAMLMSRLTGRPEKAAAPFGLHSFTLLEQEEDVLIYGLIGRFWTLNYGLQSFADSTEFIAFDKADCAKLALGFLAEPVSGTGKTRLSTETRIFCPNEATRRKFLPYWLLIRPASGLIRRRLLYGIRQRSEMPRA